MVIRTFSFTEYAVVGQDALQIADSRPECGFP